MLIYVNITDRQTHQKYSSKPDKRKKNFCLNVKQFALDVFSALERVRENVPARRAASGPSALPRGQHPQHRSLQPLLGHERDAGGAGARRAPAQAAHAAAQQRVQGREHLQRRRAGRREHAAGRGDERGAQERGPSDGRQPPVHRQQ